MGKMGIMENEIWKIRGKKYYQEAKNHIFIGKVMEVTPYFVRMCCRTFHFKKIVNGMEDVIVGTVAERIIPWKSIEVINVLENDFKFKEAELKFDSAGTLSFTDGIHGCHICKRKEIY
jgi:hypothetical protein